MAHDESPAGFLSRWSRRKADVREGRPLDEPKPVPSVGTAQTRTPQALTPSAAPAEHKEAPVDAQPAQSQPAPTLADVQQLTAESDYTGFLVRGVAPDVKNAAMKKLFTDPHFNVMDRMDIYIDDYSQPDPLPMAMLRQMTSAKTLNLFDEEAQKPLDAGAQPVSDASLNDTATPSTPQDSDTPEAGHS